MGDMLLEDRDGFVHILDSVTRESSIKTVINNSTINRHPLQL